MTRADFGEMKKTLKILEVGVFLRGGSEPKRYWYIFRTYLDSFKFHFHSNLYCF